MGKRLVIGIVVGLVALSLAKTSVFAMPADLAKEVVVQGLNNPTDFAQAPDGRFFILEQGGIVKIFKNGALLPQPFISLPVNTQGERGLLGIAFDPQFATNHYVYLYYVNDNPLEIRVSRFTEANNQVVPGSEQILLKSTQPLNLNHHSGTLRFGPDGKLWISVGNNTIPSNPQDLSNIHGKLLRINKDGSIPQDNPFVANPNAAKAIWAYGLRNPFRFSFLPDGRPIIGDVGEGLVEEVNIGVKGGNYGFPNAEGPCTNCSYINPFFWYPHNNQSASVTGGFVYTGSTLPAQYKNSYFYGDYAKGMIHRLTLDAAGNLIGDTTVDDTVGTVVELLPGADGNIYYLDIYPGTLNRIVPSTANQPPTAAFTASPTQGAVPLTVAFSASGSSDPKGKPLTYAWDFGDGTTGSGVNPSHKYTAKGAYTVKLTVNNGTDTSLPVTQKIAAGVSYPTVTITSPSQSSTYNAGQTISYAADATDAQDGALPSSAYSWTIVFHHSTHIHPFLGPLTNHKSGSFAIPTVGEPSADTSYELQLTVTNSLGLSTTVSRTITPNKVTITLDSNPHGLMVYLDGMPHTTPYAEQGVVGFKRTIDTDTPQTINNANYQFVSWSDWGTKSHQITTPNTNTSFTTQFMPVGSGNGRLAFRIQEYNQANKWTGTFLDGATVKLTDIQGNTVYKSTTSAAANGQPGWVFFENVPVGTYGIMAYKSSYQGIWKQVDCSTAGGSFTNAQIVNGNTASFKAAWDNNVSIASNQTTVCKDLGLKAFTTGTLAFRLDHIKPDANSGTGYIIDGYVNDATVKLTDTTGNTVVKTTTSGKSRSGSGQDGWVYFDDVPAGTYGVMAYKTGLVGVFKQSDCSGVQDTANATISNANTQGQIAAWNNAVTVLAGATTLCYDMGLKDQGAVIPTPQPSTGGTGMVAFRIEEFDGIPQWSGRFINGATVNLTNQQGNQVIKTTQSAVINGEDGWVFFSELPVGTYGIMAYKSGYQGVWKQVDCTSSNGSFTNATINNATTDGLTAAWDDTVGVVSGQTTVCQDLGLKSLSAASPSPSASPTPQPGATGRLAFRIQEYNAQNQWTGNFLNGAIVKLTDTAGTTVVKQLTSANVNTDSGWAIFENVTPGTYGIMAYKSGYQGIWKQIDCGTPNGSFTNATIINANTETRQAAWDNNVPVIANQTTVCKDLGIQTLP